MIPTAFPPNRSDMKSFEMQTRNLVRAGRCFIYIVDMEYLGDNKYPSLITMTRISFPPLKGAGTSYRQERINNPG
jgi:hypothetical protein